MMKVLIQIAWILTAFVTWVPTSQAAQRIAPGVMYSGGTEMSWMHHGIAIRVPEGWQATQPRGQEGLLMTRPGQLSVLAVSPVEVASVNELAALMQGPQSLGGMWMTPVGRSMVLENTVTQYYAIENAEQPMTGFVTGVVGTQGAGVVVLGLGLEANLADFSQQAGQIVRAASLDGRKDATADRLGGQWREQLSGNRLVYYDNDSAGIAERREIHLCTDGRAVTHGEVLASSNTAGSNFSYAESSSRDAGSSALVGQWRIHGNLLSLRVGGMRQIHSLERQGTETHLDGQRWFVTDGAVCS